jgi:surface protein
MKIIAQNRQHLDELITEEIKLNGNNSNLNHIDVTQVKEMHFLFADSLFNGDISKWNVSKVTHMGDIFYMSDFAGNLTNWKPLSLQKCGNAFLDCPAKEPYWAKYVTHEERINAIEKYILHDSLNLELDKDNEQKKKIKI